MLVTSFDGSRINGNFAANRKKRNHKTCAFMLNELGDDDIDRPSSIGGVITPSI